MPLSDAPNALEKWVPPSTFTPWGGAAFPRRRALTPRAAGGGKACLRFERGAVLEHPGIREVPVLQMRADQATTTLDALAVEEPLEIRVAGETLALTMRTPGNDAELAVGFLYAEGLIRSAQELGRVSHCGAPGGVSFRNTLDVIPGPGVVLDLERTALTRRGTLTSSACGVCGRKSVEDLLRACGPQSRLLKPLARERVHQAMAALRSGQANYARTGGVHAAAAVDSSGATLVVFEDVGRHNAVDKVIGSLLLRNGLRPTGVHPLGTTPAVLAVSGRTSFEIVQKAAMAHIPVVAAVSAPSSLAVSLAEQVGITLAGFVRDDRLNLYTHSENLCLP